MRLNKLCNIEDWRDADFRATLRRLLPGLAQAMPAYPTGQEHRKHWEYAHVLNGLDRLGAIHPEAMVLSVAGGHEEPAFYLTNRVRWVFLTDMYGQTGFRNDEASSSMLTSPDSFAGLPYNRNRLVVQHMNALDLRFEPETFDAVFCLSSIEHFGGEAAAQHALAEMHRATKPNGVVAITTECLIDDGPDFEAPGLLFFSQKSLQHLAQSVPGLELVEPIDFLLSEETRKSRQSLPQAISDVQNHGIEKYPHIVLECEGRLFTSVALFFRKTGTPAPASVSEPARPSRRDHADFLRAVYRGCLGRDPDDVGFVQYHKLIDEGVLNWAGVLHSVLGSEEFSCSYETQRAGDRATLALHRARKALFGQHLPAAEVVVDLGGASTWDPEGSLFALGYPHAPRELYIVDLPSNGRSLEPGIRPEMAVRAKRGTSIQYICGSMSDLHVIGNETVDLVVSGQSIEHVTEEEADRVFQEVFRVLRPGGHFCLDTPNARLTRLHSPDQLIHPEHKKEYRISELRNMLVRRGFQVAAVKGVCPMPVSLAAGKFDFGEMARNARLADSAEDCYVFFVDAVKPAAATRKWPLRRRNT
jgi:SAM-dependent methyltransferase